MINPFPVSIEIVLLELSNNEIESHKCIPRCKYVNHIAKRIYYHVAAEIQGRQSVDSSGKEGPPTRERTFARIPVPGSFSQGPLIVPLFLFHDRRAGGTLPSPDLPTYHGFLSARSSSACSPGKIGFSMSSQEISFAFVLLMGTLFSHFSFYREVFSLSFIISE